VQTECLATGAAAAFVVPVDLCTGSLPAAVEQAADAASDGSIDILIHNAGLFAAVVFGFTQCSSLRCRSTQAHLPRHAGASQRALAEETEPAVVERMFSLNTAAPINLTRLALPLLLKNGSGRVVAISSMAGSAVLTFVQLRLTMIDWTETTHTKPCLTWQG